MNHKKTLFCVSLSTLLFTAPAFSQVLPPPQSAEQTSASETGWWNNLPKEKKALYANAAAVSFVTLYGFADWDYGSAGFSFAHEGWFEKDSKYGGADKAGHFWATFALSDAFTGLYKHWGYDSHPASSYGAFSAWAVQALMELEDGTSKSQGFDWADMTMNTIGALTSVLLERYPDLDRKIDFRVEYAFNTKINGIFDDYSNMYYAVAVKLDGFDALENTWLQWFELQGGYYSRGYDTTELAKERDLYVGVSVNFSKLFRQHDYQKTGKLLEYLQVPYTVPKLHDKLN
ncbi:DUF2279 domain-containing protein [Candidatus Electronema sp. JM]|uniref:DUF2279 domain-containing protein n=1 Tax=Candidatus Electronema sp. JM TaxID=3401571 RepID=UPI003AA8CC03